MKLLVIAVVILSFPFFACAETILLKSGNSIEGKIVEKTGEYIKIEVAGVPITCFLDEIESIDGIQVFPPVRKQDVSVEIKPAGETDIKTVTPSLSNLPFSTAVITYKDTGQLYNGKEIVYIDAKNGRVSRDTFVEGKIGCAVKKINKRDICDGKTICNVDIEEGTAPTFPVQSGDAIENIFLEGMYRKYYKGEKLFLGKKCKVYSSMPGEEFYFWNGILLKQVTTNHPMGKAFSVNKEAVDIKLDVPIPEDKFQVPEGIKVMSEEETMEDFRRKLEQLKGVKKEDFQKMMENIKKIGGS